VATIFVERIIGGIHGSTGVSVSGVPRPRPGRTNWVFGYVVAHRRSKSEIVQKWTSEDVKENPALSGWAAVEELMLPA
jgi:hypothetical protein